MWVIFYVMFVISCASEIFTGNFADLNEGYSNIDVTGDGKPENIFLRRSKIKDAVSKLIITDISGKLLFFISNEGGYTQIYTGEEDILKENKFLDDPYSKLVLERETKQDIIAGRKPIILELSEEEKNVFKREVPAEEKMQDVQKKLLVLSKNGIISKNESLFGFFVYHEKNSDFRVVCFKSNSEGRPASDKLTFRWNEQNKKFIQIGISPYR